jgi:hypothetical protein
LALPFNISTEKTPPNNSLISVTKISSANLFLDLELKACFRVNSILPRMVCASCNSLLQTSNLIFLCALSLTSIQAQTPQQRKSNLKFAKEQTAKMGKPESAIKKKDKDFKSPISPVWLGMIMLAYLPLLLC